eukprot:CAMPEP_0170546420 /NCGR_PEP_ID=MMETSP0211-20121228/4776_1 /TAXON_ID=311385 /ORGANISM="Pseudokeronopsis sp., Strain OXSARD2" /LENGTH=119 /DNA_ID=CAMNT_0010850885 /DNA_START=742 /DNA_END=1101 /DNA_ORIENTATION=+
MNVVQGRVLEEIYPISARLLAHVPLIEDRSFQCIGILICPFKHFVRKDINVVRIVIGSIQQAQILDLLNVLLLLVALKVASRASILILLLAIVAEAERGKHLVVEQVGLALGAEGLLIK